ncbi:MAG: hypothetical protein OEV78_12985 [Spirochaetia bacterium]|nr:hypothetical protein [Spirochaetia bacterium]
MRINININVIAILSSIVMVFALLFNTIVDKKLILNIHISKEADNLKIDKDSLTELEKIIKSNNSLINDNTLIQVLENQKNYYNFVITVFAAMLAIAGLFSFFKGLIEKEDKLLLDKTLKEAKEELLNLKVGHIRNNFMEKSSYLEKRFRLINDTDYSEVRNSIEYKNWLKRVIKKFLQEGSDIGKIDLLIESTIIPNFILYAGDYANHTFYKDIEKEKVNIEIFDYLIDVCHTILETNKYEKLKQYVLKSFENKLLKNSFERY